MARVFITGGSGFIGTNLIDSFLADGFEVLNLDIEAPRKQEHGPLWVQGDIRNAGALSGALRDFQPDFVVHLAARCDLDGGSLAEYDANTTGVENILAATRAAGSPRRLILASTRYVHRTELFPARDDDYSPFTLYGESKMHGERIVRASNLEIPWTLIRPTSIWGPWFRIPYRQFFDTVRRGLYVHPQGERISKSYGYVGNVVHQIRGFLKADAALVDRKTFYVSDDHNMEVLEFAHVIQKAFGAPRVHEVPLFVLQTLAAGGDMLKKLGMRNPPMTSFRLNNLRTQMHYDLSATVAVAGPSPYSLEQGVELTVEWVKQHG